MPRHLAEQAVEYVNQALKDGFRPQGVFVAGAMSAVKEAGKRAMQDGAVKSDSAFKNRVARAKSLYGIEPDESNFRPRQYTRPPIGSPPIANESHMVEDEPEGDPVHIGVIGDAHDAPHLRDKSRFKWLGRYFAEKGVKRVVSVGDWLSLDCFSTHNDRSTFEGIAKPTFAQELDSFHASMRAFYEGLDGHKPILDITLGNHEFRATRYDNLHPDGVSHAQMLEEAFRQWGFRVTPYGQFRFIEGVGFIHVPLNSIGKPLAQGQRANKAMGDIIHGDDHRSLILTDYKIGPFRSPQVYSAATALPCGYIEGYASKGGSTWRSGACLATLWGGHVREWSFKEMILLRRQYD